MTREEHLKRATDELWTALKAIEDGDLPFARSSAVRASTDIVSAHQATPKPPKPDKTDGLIKALTLTD